MRDRYDAEKKKKIASTIRQIDKSGSSAFLSEFAAAFFVHGAAEDVSAYRTERLIDIDNCGAISDIDAQLSMTTGVVGGLAYWLVAGRTAGDRVAVS